MPLYRMFCITAHYPEYRQIKDLVSSSARFLLDQGSVVRDVRFLGPKTLPQRMRRHKHYHSMGDYWFMNFDASPRTLAQLNERMRNDHRVIRWTMLKLGERLTDIADTRQATIHYDNSILEKGDNSTWSTGTQGLPGEFSGPVSPSAALPGTGLNIDLGTDGEVAALNLGGDVDRANAAIAQLGAGQYARERI